jgi:hypothetical protein
MTYYMKGHIRKNQHHINIVYITTNYGKVKENKYTYKLFKISEIQYNY